jgi:putative endonuclease
MSLPVIKADNSYWVYILECQNGSYYTGYTNDLDQRYQLHLKGKASKYTRSFKPLRIAFSYKLNNDKLLALKLERDIKKLSRQQKNLLIASPALLSTFFTYIDIVTENS